MELDSEVQWHAERGAKGAATSSGLKPMGASLPDYSQKAASGGYQQPPAAHQPQPAHQSNYERQAAAYQHYAQQYAQQQQQQQQQSSPPSSQQQNYQQPSPSSHAAPAAHSGGYSGSHISDHASAAAAYQQQQQSTASLYHQQAAQYNAQMLANYASVANMGMAAQMGRAQPAASPAKGGKRKKNKDPNRPKRPTSAYFFYVAHCRAECEKRGERITRVAQWTKEISQVWREMSPEERKHFDEKAVADKQRYEEQMNRYKGRDKNRPKRPQSAYFLWLAGFRTRMKDKIPVNKELLRAAGEHWKRLTEVEKAPYEQMAEGERRKYEEAMRQYNMNGGAKRARLVGEAAGGGESGSPQQESPPTPTQTQPPQVSSPAVVPPQPASSAPQSLPSMPAMSSTPTMVVPPGMHPSMVAAINMMGHQQHQQMAVNMVHKNGQARGPMESEEEDEEDYTDEEEEEQ